MSVENQPGLLESWEKIQFEKGNELAVRTAQLLRAQYGDEPIPTQIIEPASPPPINTTRDFLISAIRAGAHLIRPKSVSLDSWILTRNIIGSYFLSGSSQTKVAEAYGLSQPVLYRRFRFGLKNLWLNSPVDIKERFPISRITRSKKQNLTDMLQQGIPVEQIKHDLGLSNQTLNVYRYQLKRAGIEVPTLPRRHSTEDTLEPIQSGTTRPRVRIKPLSEGHKLHPTLKKALESRYTPPIYANDKIRDFLKAVITQGVHLQKPQRLTDETWVERKNIVGVYFSSVANLEDLGIIYNYSTEWIRQIIAETLTDLYIASPESIRQQFTLDDILSSQGKPKDRKYRDLLAGRNNRLIELLEQGANVGKMAAELQVIPVTVRKRLSVLSELGINIPLSLTAPMQEHKKVINGLQDTGLDDEKVQELLNKVTRKQYTVCVGGENPVLMTMAKIASECGFWGMTRHMPEFIKALKDAHLPLRILTSEVKTGPQIGTYSYHFIVSWQKERAKQILLAAPELKRFLENPVLSH